MTDQDLPIVGITMGDAAGVGPEIIAMAREQFRSQGLTAY